MIKHIIKITTACIMIAGLLLLSSGPVAASCPVPLAGQFSLTYNNGTKLMSACKFGDSYRNLCGLPGAACTSGEEGDLEYSSSGSVLRYCNGSNWINIQCESLTSCVGTTAGTISADSAQMKYCNGSTWQAMYNDGICTGIGVQEAIFVPTGASAGVDAVRFGMERNISISDDYAVVGANSATVPGIFSGAATVWKRSGTTWSRLKELQPSPYAAWYRLGPVAIDGQHIIAAMPGNTRIAIFRQDQGGADNWGQVVSRTGNGCHGEWVDIFGDRAIASSYCHTGSGTSLNVGRARIYRQNRGGANNWGEIIIENPEASPNHYDEFGRGVAIAGDIAAISSRNRILGEPTWDAGAVHLFHEASQDNWVYLKKLTNPNGVDSNDWFGAAVDIIDLDRNGTADRLVVSAPYDDEQFGDRGTLFIFERNQGGANNWGLVAKTSDATVSPTSRHVGRGQIGLGGDYIVAGSPLNDAQGNEAGAVLVFRKDQGGPNNWGLQTYLWGSDTNLLDELGNAVAVSPSGNTFLAAARYKEGDGGGAPGAAYIFENTGASWTERTKLTPPGTYEYSVRMGDSVAVSGDYAATGIIYKSGHVSTNRVFNEGGINIYRRQPDATWVLDRHVVPSALQWDLNFGRKLDISPEILAVAVPLHNISGADRSGGAILYGRNVGGPGNWGEIKILKASDRQAEDRAGDENGLALFGDYLALGAFREDRDLVVPQMDAGAAYIFKRNHGGVDNWGEIKKIVSSVKEDRAYFGWSVDLTSTTLVVGARQEDANGIDSGAAYVFERDHGGSESWGEIKRLIGAAAYDYFGHDVAVSGDTIVVGAYGNDTGGGDRGIVYIYYRNLGGAGNWGLHKSIPYPGPVGNGHFGRSVDLSGDILIVGAPVDDSFATDGGRAYVYSRNEGGTDNWGLLATIEPNVPSAGDSFGWDVAVSGNIVAASGLYNDDAGIDDGSVYLFGCPQN